MIVSPEVHSDRTVTFRYSAPNAHTVTVQGELDGLVHTMTRDRAGLWSTRVGPLAPDIYTYTFDVDGVVALDPLNPTTKIGYWRFGAASVVEVPGDSPAFYDVQAVPQGEVRIRPYFSGTFGVARTLWIYTPPGYESGVALPTFYLIHGVGDIESGWTLAGRANVILDNLIAAGRAVPMVIVMPLGHPVQSSLTGPRQLGLGSGPEGIGLDVGPDGPFARQDGTFGAFATELIDEIIPLVEQNYAVSRYAEDRAIGGLSMGGLLTMNVAFNRPDLFRDVVIMSAGATEADESYPSFFASPMLTNQQLRLLWLGISRDDALARPGAEALDATLRSRGIVHEFEVVEGRHEWTVWRRMLRDVAPRLFARPPL